MSVYDKLSEFHINLPPVAVPAAAYVPFVQSGKLVFLSGHIAKKDGNPWVGQLGHTMQTAEGKEAARAVAIDLLSTLHTAVGDLNKIQRIVKVMSLVNSTADFVEHHLVTNGCSEVDWTNFWRKRRARAQCIWCGAVTYGRLRRD